VLVFFKLRYAPPNDVLQAEGFHLFLERVGDLGRYAIIAGAFGKYIVHWGNYLLLPLIVFALVSGVKPDQRFLPTILSGCIMLILMFLGFFFVYVLTPHDLHWHLKTSLERLLLQLWPTFLFLVFLVLGPWGQKAGQSVQGRPHA
jgi:hypothetical protein